MTKRLKALALITYNAIYVYIAVGWYDHKKFMQTVREIMAYDFNN